MDYPNRLQIAPHVGEETVRELWGKKRRKPKEKSTESKGKKKKEPALLDRHSLVDTVIEEDNARCRISLFDDSVENHFREMDKIFDICGETGSYPFQEDDVDRLSNSVTFLREWRYFNYKPRNIFFTSDTQSSVRKDAFDSITLPQFSAVQTPKAAFSSNEASSADSRNDFVLYAGGAVWSLDWCPMEDTGPDLIKTCEFIAISTHPPDSIYHKLGAPVSGRGMVQIWCLLNTKDSKEDALMLTGKPKRYGIVKKKDDSQPKRPRGRPRKYPVDMMSNNPECENQCKIQVKRRGRPRKIPENMASRGQDDDNQPLAIAFPQGALHLPSVENVEDIPVPIMKQNNDCQDDDLGNEGESQLGRRTGRPEKIPIKTYYRKKFCKKQALEVSAADFLECAPLVHFGDGDLVKLTGMDGNKPASSTSKRKQKSNANGYENSKLDNTLLSAQHMDVELSTCGLNGNSMDRCGSLPASASDHNGSVVSLSDYPASEVPFIPRVVMCLGHDGKVAWDLKWRPCSTSKSECKGRIGYLAVVLGNGSLEVWEIPSPQIMKTIYLSQLQEGTDPRFVKLKPVFRCATLKCGDRQSIPLTVEWSNSSPHNLILAGCHDGMVALWKFSVGDSSKDVRPLLYFSADTAPIRAIAWAPNDSSPESANVIVTAGHEGMKFWDVRDPFRPLWDISAQRFIYSLDWLPEPRCVVTSCDDGTLRILSLSKAANDAPVTGKQFGGTQQQGSHNPYCSSFAIWSVHSSRHTGLVAYCGADGTVLYFQLTSKAVDKDPSRNRAPCFLCGSLIEEGGDIIVNIPSTNAPYPMKRSLNGSVRGFVYDSNNARREKDQAAANKEKNDDQPLLALCYGDEDIGSEDVMSQPLQAVEKHPKGRGSGSGSGLKQGGGNGPSTMEDDEDTKRQNKKGEKDDGGGDIEVIPSEMVAMHRVRWNMNKGSSRWLCYGGAAGIVRCQKIVAPKFEKKHRKA